MHIEQWQQHLAAAGAADTTRSKYAYFVTRFATDHDLAGASTETIEQWMAAQPWGPHARKCAQTSLKSFYHWATRRGIVDGDPTAGLSPVRQPRPLAKPTQTDLLARALASATGVDYWILRIASTTGLRRSELAALHHKDLVRQGDSWWLHIEGKGKQLRFVPVPDDVAAYIEAKDGWVFPSPVRHGQHVCSDYIGRHAKRALEGAATTHTLRHRYATDVYHATGDLLATQRLLGHSSPATTQSYIAPDFGRLVDAARSTWSAA